MLKFNWCPSAGGNNYIFRCKSTEVPQMGPHWVPIGSHLIA